MQPHPVELQRKQDLEVLEIRWSDGREDVLSLRYLRGWCPCALCQGHFAMKKTFIDNVSTQLESAEPVGGYGIRLGWADGHTTGIYSFQYLREIAEFPPDEGPSNEQCLASRDSLN